MKKWWRKHRPGILSGLLYAIVRGIGITLRLRVEGEQYITNSKTGMIFSGWHGKSFIPANYFKGKGVWALFSLSNDGEMQSRIFRKFGFRVIRGSTGRGGVRAAIEGIKVLREGASMAVTPDGPRGPAEVVQGGVLTMAQKSGAAIIPVGSAARPRKEVPSWDKYMVPAPFAKSALVFGEPIYVPKDADEEQLEEIRTAVESAIQNAEQRAISLIS